MMFHDVHSGLPLPSLVTVRGLPPREREQALEGWVAWLGANRHRVSTTVERLLDHALRELRDDSVRRRSAVRLEQGYRRWLDNAGAIGKGRGPDERDDSA